MRMSTAALQALSVVLPATIPFVWACGNAGGPFASDRPSRAALLRDDDAATSTASQGDASTEEESLENGVSGGSGERLGASQGRVVAAISTEPDAALPAEPSDRFLGFGTAETLVRGINAAEDVMFSDDERLFVTGNDGIYELQRDSSGHFQATNLHPGESCLFTGIVEVQATLYVACADYTNSYLFAASLAGSPARPVFRKIHTMAGTIIANEIAADPEGRIYVAASLQAKILRLQLSAADPFTVSGQEDWLSTPSGIVPNGVKYIDSSIYWTDSLGGSVNRALILLDGSPGPISSFVDLGAGIFDDLYVNSNGTIIVASYLTGTLRAYGPLPLGSLLAQTPPGVFSNPADVLPARGRLGFEDQDLIVTDKGASSVVVFHMPF